MHEFHEIKTKLENVAKENTKLKSETGELLRKMTILAKKQINNQQIVVVKREQYSRNYILEVRGVPELQNENVFQLISKMGTPVGEDATTDGSVSHGVPGKESGKTNLMVHFQNRGKRDALLEMS